MNSKSFFFHALLNWSATFQYVPCFPFLDMLESIFDSLGKSKIISIIENETQKMVSNGFSKSCFFFFGLMNSSSSYLMGYCTLAKE